MQIVLLVVGVICEKPDNEHKPEAVEWQENNFGVRTFHKNEDVLIKENVDTNDPHIPIRVTQRHHPKRNENKEIRLRNNLRIRNRNRVQHVKEPGELEPTTEDTKKLDSTYSGRSGSANHVARRKTLRTLSETKQARQSSGTINRTGGFRSPRLRSRVHHRDRETNEAETLETGVMSSLKLKPNFADFKAKYFKNISRSPNRFVPKKTLHPSETSNKTTTKATTSTKPITTTKTTTSKTTTTTTTSITTAFVRTTPGSTTWLGPVDKTENDEIQVSFIKENCTILTD